MVRNGSSVSDVVFDIVIYVDGIGILGVIFVFIWVYFSYFEVVFVNNEIFKFIFGYVMIWMVILKRIKIKMKR